MSIATISGASGPSAVSQASSRGTKRMSSAPPPPQAGASANISKPGELISKLKQLQQQDPAKFKEVTAQLSKDLKEAAGNTSGPAAEALNKLADGLAKASTSGDLQALAPQGGAKAPGHHHHHHGGGGAESQALSSAVASVTQALGAGASTPTVAAPTPA